MCSLGYVVKASNIGLTIIEYNDFLYKGRFTSTSLSISFCVDCSASADGRIFVRKIMEGPEDGKVLITEQIVLAVQIVGDWESCHPRLCWNLQMQVLS